LQKRKISTISVRLLKNLKYQWGSDMTPLEENIGSDLYQRLVESVPGKRLYVPMKVTTSLKRVGLTPEQSMQLTGMYAGETIIVPTGHRERVQKKHQAILIDRAKGISAAQLAKKHRVTIRQVWNVLKKGAVCHIV
jgi:Mor family transcriptional regulator